MVGKIKKNSINRKGKSMEGNSDHKEYIRPGCVPKSHQSGLIALSVLFTPLLITCLMVFTSLIFCVRNHDLSQSICIRHVLQIQRRIKNHLTHLLYLNPVADHLRNKYKSTQSLYKKALLSNNAVLVGILKTKLMFIQKQRIALDRKQQSILKRGKRDVQQSWSAFKKELMKFHPDWTKKKHPRPIPLAVLSRPKRDIAKSYYVPTKFSMKQRIEFSWSIPIDRFLPQIFQKTFFEKKFSAYMCAATLYQKGKRWSAGLIP